MNKWITTNWEEIALSLLSLVMIYVTIIALTRLVGLRSFSKISASDFAMTVAVGSLLATCATNAKPPLVQGLAIFCAIFFLRWLFAFLRRSVPGFSRLMDNTPLLLMDGPRILENNLQRANVTRQDLIAKLREANVLSFSQVRAVVFETTGDISVLHTDDDVTLDDELLDAVISR